MKQVIKNNEQLIRKVSLIGNGAHVFTPREWLNDEVLLIRVPKKSAEDEILDILKPYLQNILGVYLYGSYARNEQTLESDVDVLVITNKKLSIKKKNYEIIAIEEKNIEKVLEISPILILSALSEAKPIINSKLLEELRKKYKIEYRHVKEYLKQTKEFIKVNEKYPSLYSLVLRLRGIYIINQLFLGKLYSKKGFILWISKHISKIDLEKIKNYKDDYNLNKEEANSLINLLKNEVKRLEVKSGEKKKTP